MNKYLLLIYRAGRSTPLIATIDAPNDFVIRMGALELMDDHESVTGVIVQTMQERIIMTAAKRIDDHNVIDLNAYRSF